MKTAAQIWLDYGRTLNVGATEKALAELDGEIERLRAALRAMVEAWDMSGDEGQHRRIWDDAREALGYEQSGLRPDAKGDFADFDPRGDKP